MNSTKGNILSPSKTKKLNKNKSKLIKHHSLNSEDGKKNQIDEEEEVRVTI